MKAIELLRFLQTLNEVQLELARVYYDTEDYVKSAYSVELDEVGDVILN